MVQALPVSTDTIKGQPACCLDSSAAMTVQTFKLEVKMYEGTSLPEVICFSGDPARAKAKMAGDPGQMLAIYKALMGKFRLEEGLNLQEALQMVASPTQHPHKTPLLDKLYGLLEQPPKRQKSAGIAQPSPESHLGSKD